MARSPSTRAAEFSKEFWITMKLQALRWLGGAVLAAGLGASSCTVVSVQSQEAPVGLRADGLVDGHAVVGWRDEKQAVRLDLFDGTSSGAVFEFVLWRIARLELGLAGFGVGVGPFDVALGALAYDPHMPIASTPSKAAKSKGTKDADAKSASDAKPAAGAKAEPCDEPGCSSATPAPVSAGAAGG